MLFELLCKLQSNTLEDYFGAYPMVIILNMCCFKEFMFKCVEDLIYLI